MHIWTCVYRLVAVFLWSKSLPVTSEIDSCHASTKSGRAERNEDTPMSVAAGARQSPTSLRTFTKSRPAPSGRQSCQDFFQIRLLSVVLGNVRITCFQSVQHCFHRSN